MKLFSIASTMAALAWAQDAQAESESQLMEHRRTFEDWAQMYGIDSAKYTPEEKDWQQRLTKFLITVLNLEHIDTFTPSFSHAKTDETRGNTDSQVERHGRVVELDLYGRGWDTEYEVFYYEQPTDSKEKWNLGVRFEVNTQLDLNWRLPIFMNIHEKITLLDFAPILNLETNAWATMEIHVWFWNLIFEAWVQPYSFTPFDISMKVDPVKPQRYCHGIDYYGEALVFKIDYEQEINECHLGMFGWLFPIQEHGNQIENLDCVWRNYKPEVPLFKTQITQAGDFYGPYYNYRCMAWHKADWEEWPLTQATVMTARAERLENSRNN